MKLLDPIEREIELAFCPGRFISFNEVFSFSMLSFDIQPTRREGKGANQIDEHMREREREREGEIARLCLIFIPQSLSCSLSPSLQTDLYPSC